jgi:hypothetical protein
MAEFIRDEINEILHDSKPRSASNRGHSSPGKKLLEKKPSHSRSSQDSQDKKLLEKKPSRSSSSQDKKLLEKKPSRSSQSRRSSKSSRRNSSSLRRIHSFTRKYKEKQARKKIGVFMKKTEHKRKSKFLQAICSDSGVCIAFGKERKKIFDFFNGFTNFDYLTSVNSIGAVSANGFVKELEYEREEYKANAILKSAKEKESDNLMYEYWVGLIINSKFLNYVPCFIETYGHYRYRKESDWYTFQREKQSKVDLNTMLIPFRKGILDYDESCTYSKTMCILVQHIKGAASIGDKIITRTPDLNFIINDLLYSFYQIYYALGLFSSVFTHYDLHPYNVILYKPVENKYIEFHYHLPDGTIINFKSQYIAKTIDYGRCFVYKQGFNSKSYYDDLCKYAPACNENGETCGDDSGYAWLKPPLEKQYYYISSTINNRSHDLRLLNDLSTRMPWHREPLKSNVRLCDHLKSIFERLKYDDINGTPPVIGKVDGVKIEDVSDAKFCIRKIIMTVDQKKANDDYYSRMAKLGDLHVYGNKPMEFIHA